MTKLFTSIDSSSAKKLSRSFKQGQVRRIYQGVYTNNLTDPLDKIVKQFWMNIVSHIVPKGILSYRTAVDIKPISYQKDLSVVFVTSSYTKTIKLPGLIIQINKGNYEDFLEQISLDLARSNLTRMLLENLKVVRKAEFKGIKTIGEQGVEMLLAKEMRLRKEDWLNRFREDAKKVATKLDLGSEYTKLNKIISALLSSHSINYLKTPYAKAVVKKEPYDANRLQLFEKLSVALQKCIFIEREFKFNSTSFKNLSFFEAYFSNYIEGTEFLIDEAEDIVFSGHEIKNRHADSHDVLSNFRLTSDYLEMTTTPKDAMDFINLLKTRHAYLMRERPEKEPGEFKKLPNKAGNTYFVEPEDVLGTLLQGFELYKILKDGLTKALFMQVLISEIHPFADGNGRLSRIMMNAELVKVGQIKIMVPTVMRDNYLNGLRLLSRDHLFKTYCKVMDQMQAYTLNIDWQDYGAVREKIEGDYADKASDEGLPIFNRILRTLTLSEFVEDNN